MEYLPKDSEAVADKVLRVGNSYLICDSSEFCDDRSPSEIILEKTALPLTSVVSISGIFKQSRTGNTYDYLADIKLSFINNDVSSKSLNYKISAVQVKRDGRVNYLFDRERRATIDIKAKSTMIVNLPESFVAERKPDESCKLIFQIEEARLIDVTTKSTDQIVKEFSKTFDDDTFKDIKFVVGDESFMAHKFVIAARSDVFHAMLAHDTKEKKEGIIEIQDVGMPALKSFIKYLYTDQVDNIEEIADELLMLADKYNVLSLQNKCQVYMCENNKINESNVISYLIKAHTKNIQFLKKLALVHIRFYIKKLMETKDLDLLEPYPSLSRDIFTLIADDDADSSAKRLGISC